MRFFLPYQENTKEINLLYILCLFGIAEYNKQTKLFDTVNYSSVKELKKRINDKMGIDLSLSTIERFINKLTESKTYNLYAKIDKEKKQIILNNDFRNRQSASFVVLDEQTLQKLTEKKDDLFCKYYLCLLYNIGRSKEKSTTLTAPQILEKMGYSSRSGQYKSKLGEYNAILKSEKLIAIKGYIDAEGHKRNLYTLP